MRGPFLFSFKEANTIPIENFFIYSLILLR
jgi:hypothetical protein